MQTWLPIIDEKLCTACQLCITHCPTEAVGLVRNVPCIDQPEACVYCGLCEEICPTGAVSLPYEIIQ